MEGNCLPLVPHLEPVTTEPLKLMTRLTEALDQRFDDLDEVKDISKHGCSGGFSGFIYYKELRDFFFEYENEIEAKLDELDLTLADAPEDSKHYLSGLITWAVWVVVESYCHERAEAEEMALTS
tara:strand:- start:75 stop:446 length:372 start_codon:yes stop_codon:yes gene_type:complete